MKKIILFLLASFVLLGTTATLAPSVFAFNPLDTACSSAPDATACKDRTTTNPILGQQGILTKALNIFSLIIGIVAVVMIIIAGISFMTSSGDSAKVSTARNSIIYAIVGLVVVVLAQGIVIFVLNRF